MGLVAVKNKSADPFVDTYNGTPYRIPAEQITKVPAEAAKLWFGIGGNDLDRHLALRRRGLLHVPAWLDNFVPVQVTESYVEQGAGKPQPSNGKAAATEVSSGNANAQ